MSNNMPKNWSKIKKRWKKRNPPDKDGNYQCWRCPHKVHISKLTLDHVATLELYPEYATNLSNLRPAHEWCNQERARGNRTALNLLRGRKILRRIR